MASDGTIYLEISKNQMQRFSHPEPVFLSTLLCISWIAFFIWSSLPESKYKFKKVLIKNCGCLLILLRMFELHFKLWIKNQLLTSYDKVSTVRIILRVFVLFKSDYTSSECFDLVYCLFLWKMTRIKLAESNLLVNFTCKFQ